MTQDGSQIIAGCGACGTPDLTATSQGLTLMGSHNILGQVEPISQAGLIKFKPILFGSVLSAIVRGSNLPNLSHYSGSSVPLSYFFIANQL